MTKILATFLTAGLCMLITLTGCGSAGSASTSSTSSTSSTGTNTLSVTVASPAPNTGASCILRDSAGDTISGPITSSSGLVSFTFLASIPNSWMSIVCTGGTYTDPATQVAVILSSATILRNTFYYEVGTTTSLVVTPLTEIAYRNIIGYLYQNYPAQLAQITTILGLGSEDVSDVTPTDVNQTKAGADVAGQYGTLMAVLSEMMKDNPASYPDLKTLITALFNNIQDGALAATVKADMLAAMSNLTTNTSIKDKVTASMAEIGGSQYTTLSEGNGVGTLVETVYSGGTITVNQSYATLIATATGGTPPYHFQLDTLANGSPPTGMSVDLNGYLTGTPTVTGTYTFGVCAVDLVATSTCKSTAVTVLAATTSASTSGDYFYHWNCNGDSECLTTNPNGTSTGTVDEGPGVGGQSSCNSLLTFASHFWGDAAVSSCDQSSS